MKILKPAAGIVAGALALFSVGFTYAAPLNLNLGNRPEGAERAPLMLVAESNAAAAPAARPRAPKRQSKVPPPAVASPEPAPSAAEIVGRLLSPGASDPDVPLPHPDLAARPDVEKPLDGPRLFGRGEPGGGVLGLRMPIPVQRSRTSTTTRYGSDGAGSGAASGSPLETR